MNIKVKDGECWGTVYVVVFDNDGTYEPRVFTKRDSAHTFVKCLGDCEYTIFEETLDRSVSEYMAHINNISSQDARNILKEVDRELSLQKRFN